MKKAYGLQANFLAGKLINSCIYYEDMLIMSSYRRLGIRKTVTVLYTRLADWPIKKNLE